MIGIHHPGGSYKRVSFGNLTTAAPICGGLPTAKYWYLDWYTGITEGGSSGSPLFNSNWEVVGQLYGVCYWIGTTPGCDNPEDYNNVYGKFGSTYSSISSYLNSVATDDAYEDNDVLAQAAPLPGKSATHPLQLVDFDDYFSESVSN